MRRSKNTPPWLLNVSNKFKYPRRLSLNLLATACFVVHPEYIFTMEEEWELTPPPFLDQIILQKPFRILVLLLKWCFIQRKKKIDVKKSCNCNQYHTKVIYIFIFYFGFSHINYSKWSSMRNINTRMITFGKPGKRIVRTMKVFKIFVLKVFWWAGVVTHEEPGTADHSRLECDVKFYPILSTFRTESYGNLLLFTTVITRKKWIGRRHYCNT